MSDKVTKAKHKLDKAVAKRDKLDAKIPKKKKQRLYEKESAKSTLKFSEDMPKPSAKLLDKPKGASGMERVVQKAPQNTLKATIHQEISKNEDDNVGVESVHKTEQSAEFAYNRTKSAYRHQKEKPYLKLEKAETKVQKAGVNYSHQKALVSDPSVASNPISRFQQKQAIKKQYTMAFRQGGQSTASAVKATVQKGASAVSTAVSAVAKNPKVWLVIGCAFLLIVIVASVVSSCSVLVTGSLSQTVGTSYPSEDADIVSVDNQYTLMETALQAKIDGIETTYPNYDEYRYNIDSIQHDSHQLAAYLTALELYYQAGAVDGQLQTMFDNQYTLTITSEVEVRYRTEERTGTYTTTDDDGNVTEHEYTYEVQVPYDYYILNVTLDNKGVDTVANDLLSAEELEMYLVYKETQGNKPLLFGGGSTDGSPSTDLSGVVFVDGERAGNQNTVNIAMSQVGNVGGQPYWSWYGFGSRVEWCACYVSWVLNQAGYSEPKFASCQSQGVPYFSSQGRWASVGYADIAAGDVIFFDWDGDNSADHVGIVVGTDGSRVYTVEGNSGDACKVRDYAVNSSVIMGYGLMN